MKVLITGATGFVGRALTERLQTQLGAHLHLSSRKNQFLLSSLEGRNSDSKNLYFQVGSLGPETNWRMALDGVDVVVHLAARVHIMNEKSSDPLASFRKANTQGTRQLARQAAQAGCKRFIFLSSVKVNGEETFSPYRPEDTPAPVDAYGISKHEAEVGLAQVAQETGMDVVIIRPPLVYGPNVGGNFLTLMHILHKGIPLPFGKVDNQRSFVGLDNLVDLIVTCLDHPKAAGETFLVSDEHDLSTPQLLCLLAEALGKRPRLFSIPPWVLNAGAALMGKKASLQRLCGSLQVDITKTKHLLSWSPPFSVEEGFQKTACHFLKTLKSQLP